MDTDQAKDGGGVYGTMWRARTLRSWRGNGSGAGLWGGVFLLVLGAVWLPVTRNQDAQVFEVGISLMVVGGVAMGIGALAHAMSTSEWTLAGRTLRGVVRPRAFELDISRIRTVDIADRTDGACDLLLYLQPGQGGDGWGWILVERLRKEDAEAGAEALRRCGAEVARPESGFHAFPEWTSARERRALAASLGRGERLVWGRNLGRGTRAAFWLMPCAGAAWMSGLLASKFRAGGMAQGMTSSLAALVAFVFLGLFLVLALGLRFLRISAASWITTRRLFHFVAPGGRVLTLTAECLDEDPVVVPRRGNRADLFVSTMLEHGPSLADVAAGPHARRNALGLWNLSAADAEAAAAALRDVRRRAAARRREAGA